ADENAELRGTDAERFEGAVIEAGDGARGPAEVKGGTRAGAVEVEFGEVSRHGTGSDLDLYMHLRYNRWTIVCQSHPGWPETHDCSGWSNKIAFSESFFDPG